MTNRKIGILGSGQVAQVLAAGLLKHGHEVMVGTRDTLKLNDWKSKNGSGASVGSFEQAAVFGEVIILAIKGTAAESLVKQLAPHLIGKTVLDTTNPIAPVPPENGVLQYFTSQNESLMERLQKLAPNVNFVKAFNSVGSARMVNPNFAGGNPTMFIAGNDPGAKKEATALLDQLGWEVADMGKVEGARPIESLCMLWCIPGFVQNQWTHAFKLLKS